MVSRFLFLLTLWLHISCATNIVKQDLGPKNTFSTSAAFGLDSGITYALIASAKPTLTAIGYVYGGYAIFLYGIFMLLRPDTDWVTEDQTFVTNDGRGKVELSKTGRAEFTFAEPTSPGEWTTLCRARLRCNYGYGIHKSGWMFLDVSVWEPEGWSGSFEHKGEVLVWNRHPGSPLEFHKTNN